MGTQPAPANKPESAAAPAASSGSKPAEGQAANSLTPAEVAAGWQLLFDGSSTKSFRGYKKAEFPKQGWVIDNGWLKSTAAQGKGGGGDIVTVDEYSDFELQLEWKASTKGNSGIMFRVAEQHNYPWMTGAEFQVLDDASTNTKPDDKHSAGGLYDLISPVNVPGAGEAMEPKVLNAVGQTNHARIRLQRGVLQHFLNGTKVVETRVDDAAWLALIAGSKFKDFKGFGMQPKGRLAIQDHGDTMWFANIKLRDLTKPMSGEVELFDGKSLSGWKVVCPSAADKDAPPAIAKLADSTWSVADGTLRCVGTPNGYLKTEKTYANFVLKLDWRWAGYAESDSAKALNSGVLLRVSGPDKTLPMSVEAELKIGSAGDLILLDGSKAAIAEFKGGTVLGAKASGAERQNGRLVKRARTAERHAPAKIAGQDASGPSWGGSGSNDGWNSYEIIAYNGNISVFINGEFVNTIDMATTGAGAGPTSGSIGLQSEGAAVEFRNIRLAEIK